MKRTRNFIIFKDHQQNRRRVHEILVAIVKYSSTLGGRGAMQSVSFSGHVIVTTKRHIRVYDVPRGAGSERFDLKLKILPFRGLLHV